MIDPRRTGATSISRRKPNSRSHTMEMAENMAVNMTDRTRTPGKMNVLRSTPPVASRVRVAIPVPSTKT
jgi:hypothetical protein